MAGPRVTASARGPMPAIWTQVPPRGVGAPVIRRHTRYDPAAYGADNFHAAVPSQKGSGVSRFPRFAMLFLAAVLIALLGGAILAPSTAFARVQGELPVAIRIPAIDVDAEIEVRTTVGVQMQDPTGPDAVAWYDDSARLGAPGNAVLAGHLDWQGKSAVFARLEDLERGDLILMTDKDGTVYRYQVVATRVYDAATGPWVRLTGPTERQSLTLITCAPPWDREIGHYANRLVVRAVRVRD